MRLIALTSKSLNNPVLEKGSAESYLRAELLRLVLHFAALDGTISRGEAQVYSQLSNCIELESSRKYGGDLMQTDIDYSIGFLTCLMEAAPAPLERPLALSFIEEHDRANSTSYAQEARNVFIQIASALISSDGPPSSNKTAELGRYKQILQQAPSVESVRAPVIEEAKAEPTKLEALNAPEPFGFRVAMSKAQVLALVTPQSVLKDDGDSIELSTAPAPHEDFDTYVVSVSPSSGIAKVMALSKDLTTNVYGEAVKQKFDEVKAALNKKYGDPTNTFDFLGDGSVWTEPTEWMMGLAKGERTLSAFWATANNARISLEASAAAEESGYLIVQYEYSNYETWLAEHNQKRNRVL
jgi:hypothetical protein